MMIKKLSRLGALLVLGAAMLLSAPSMAKSKLTSSTFDSVVIYYGASDVDMISTMTFYVTVATPGGVGYGVYTAEHMDQWQGSTVPLVSWSGAGTAPTLVFNGFDKRVGDSHCPGIDTKYWTCSSVTMKVTVEADNNGCPWMSSFYMKNTGRTTGMSYSGPSSHSTVCAAIPVDTYDISWSPDSVQHDKVLSLTSTGGTINTVLPTYLMESGKLCDGSQYDSRGAYCRIVSMGVSLSVLGCDNSVVTTTATAHPITDKELHDINVAVNTRSVGSGSLKATCNFQYVIEQL